MGPAEGLREAIDELAAIDHHAHLLAGPDAAVDLAAVLTESREPAQVAQVRDHPAYQRALRELAALLGVEPDEGELSEVRQRHGFASHARRLMDASGLAAMLVDDGFRFPGALSLAEHADLVGCQVLRIVRIESAAEDAAEGWPPFAELGDRFRRSVADALAGGAAALKTIAAYRCGLDLPRPAAGEASAAYERWRQAGSKRLTHPALVSFFVAEALAARDTLSVPLQIHTGVGDADLTLTRANPALLQPSLDHGVLAGVPVVLLHTYPFVREASYLASVYANVHLDLSLAITLVAHRGAALVLEALDLAPATKVLFATDASRLPELYLLGTRWWRDALSRALGQLIDDGLVEEAIAVRWAGLILAGNARRLYGLHDLP